MRVVTFQQLQTEYDTAHLREGYEEKRKEMFEKYPFSVLLEGGYHETDGLEKWIKLNLGADQVNELFLIKTGYDYGFSEYFFADRLSAEKVTAIIPHIYIRYNHEDDPACGAFRTAGREKQVEVHPWDPNAIVFDAIW